ncbi:MAG: twin-arginine translocase subunit TatB [Gammaproteobacteria bacterium]|nr:MAG: twin-arginine translocase subunit TatB [Gammaproteobacteria bacterium]
MFDVGFPELVLIAVVGLLVIGPERLPETLRTLGLWLGRMRRSFAKVKSEIEKEIGMDEVRRQLHNESVMEEMKRIEAEVRNTANDTRNALSEATIHTTSEPSSKNSLPISNASAPTDPALDAIDAVTETEPEPNKPIDSPALEKQTADQTSEQSADGVPPANEANG